MELAQRTTLAFQGVVVVGVDVIRTARNMQVR